MFGYDRMIEIENECFEHNGVFHYSGVERSRLFPCGRPITARHVHLTQETGPLYVCEMDIIGIQEGMVCLGVCQCPFSDLVLWFILVFLSVLLVICILRFIFVFVSVLLVIWYCGSFLC